MECYSSRRRISAMLFLWFWDPSKAIPLVQGSLQTYSCSSRISSAIPLGAELSKFYSPSSRITEHTIDVNQLLLLSLLFDAVNL